jgi:hypothetical protein
MTDYNSQGRTCIRNMYNLSASRNHQAIYTALSRSLTSDGTVIHSPYRCTLDGIKVHDKIFNDPKAFLCEIRIRG